MRIRACYLLITLAAVLAACSPAGLEMTGVVSTAISGTVEPVTVTQSPGGTPPAPTAIPTLPGGLGPTELKYRLLAEFPNFFFCDPDEYPVAREDEIDLAVQRFPELQANQEEFQAILEHNNLAGQSTFSDAQKLLIYREHKRLAAIPLELSGDSYRFQIQVAQTEGKGELIGGLIDARGRITVQSREPSFASCPICLAAGTLIEAPGGPVRVEELRPGVLVWTLDRAGQRVARPVLRIGRTAIPAGHQVVRLVLRDGREVWLSPGHPTADGRRAGELRPGDTLDGAVILSAGLEPYAGRATYDLLPAGETGFYWANGVPIASTLAGGLK
jgi:hypothetical protein